VVATGLIAGALIMAACSSSSGTGTNTTSGTKVQGGTATFADPPGATPNWAFPFQSLTYFTVNNLSDFQQLMYRPLYWFGTGDQPTLNSSISLAKNPVYSNSGKTVTMNMKDYKWSNGEKVTAQDIMFWMNMMHAQKANWAAYAPGTIPDNIKSITVDSPTQITFNLDRGYNEKWFTYNQLSQITPMPSAWDVTALGAKSGSGGCSMTTYGTTDSQCTAVYNFLTNQSKNVSGYVTSPIWSIVDGPWKLTLFDSSGDAQFVPNKDYSGSPKPTLAKFVEVPYTTDTAEFNDLVSGNKIDYGYLPYQDVTASTNDPTTPAANNPRATGYTLAPVYPFGINYFPYNFNSSGQGGAVGKIFDQLYFRQAFQTLIDQPLYNKKIYHGYAVPTYGPVPTIPDTYASSTEKGNPYPYDLSKAKKDLSENGWKVTPGGTTTCQKAGTGKGDCGAGIPAGAKLVFNLQYASGTPSLTEYMNAAKSSWAQAGIQVNLTTATFDTVVGNATPCSGGPSCSWELENWGGGWVFAPDYYPSGEEIFATGAGSNSGDYSNPTNDNNIKQSYQTNTNLDTYQNYLAKQLPVVWSSNQAYQLSEIKNTLHGALPQNPLLNINPENWYFTSG
jgi:peptide/nickel transport system substrate-binding protein